MTDVLTVWLTIVGMGVVTFFLRFSFIALSGKLDLPASAKRALDLVPAAVFSALIFPNLLGPTITGQFTVSADARLLAGTIAVLIAWRTRNVAVTIGAGLIVQWILLSLL